MNFDGAVFQEESATGIGVVIRDEKGLVVASMADTIHLPNSVAAVEAFATVKALYFALDIGASSIILEGDLECIISALKYNIASLAAYGHLIVEAKSLVRNFFEVVFCHTQRQDNSTAHNIAKYVSKLSVWKKDIPPRLFSVILVDAAIP